MRLNHQYNQTVAYSQENSENFQLNVGARLIYLFS